MARIVLTRQRWEELAEQARYDSRDLAALCQRSDRQLRRIFERSFGRSPQEWLNERRIVAARRLLLEGQAVKEVAFNLGFKYTSHFCRQFKALNDMTPSEFVSAQNWNWELSARVNKCPPVSSRER